MKLTKEQKRIIDSKGHLLVIGGPGSGKTTISIIKAATIAQSELKSEQKVLFLSFARATVSRVQEVIELEKIIEPEHKKSIVVETYHSFFWRILKAHGYLVGLPRKLNVLSPPNEAIALSEIRNEYDKKLSKEEKCEKLARENTKRFQIAKDSGDICFDLFAKFSSDILHGSKRIQRILASMYPFIILDEFQDTDLDQWNVVQALGHNSILIALADQEQRIYDWRGADPARLLQFMDGFSPSEFDLANDNHRSKGTDILSFGNDILRGRFRSGQFKNRDYEGVKAQVYPPNQNQAYTSLLTATYAARKRLCKMNLDNWSLAILVPTKKLTRIISDEFRSPRGGLTPIHHTAIVEIEAAILGAEIISFLMQPNIDHLHFKQLIDLMKNFYFGRGGDNPTKTDIKEAGKIQKAYDDFASRLASGKNIKKSSVLVATLTVYNEVNRCTLTGDPDSDWRGISRILREGKCSRLKKAAEDARNLRILNRGSQLRQELSQDWRENGAYTNALSIVRQAFVRDHFSTNAKPESGVVIMNMHKAKGKQFDEVIIFEGWPIKVKGQPPYNADRIVR